MEKWIGRILVDVSPPERAKFKAPVILVHGLWTSSRCWRAWATHFSNLGWECWSVNFRGRFEQNALEVLKRVGFDDCVDDLREVIRAAEFPPVVVAHDLGGLAALRAAGEEKISALILLSSLPPRDVTEARPRALRLLRLKYGPLLFFGRPFRIEERDFRKLWLVPSLAGGPEPFGCLVPDGPHLIRELFDRRVKLDGEIYSAPILVVAAGEDRIAPAAAQRELAQKLGADYRCYPGHGHWIIGEDGGEEITRDIHRWIVTRSGEDLLLGDEGLDRA
jgi:pimeloyl-ACP methyl ester carboxylesterase